MVVPASKLGESDSERQSGAASIRSTPAVETNGTQGPSAAELQQDLADDWLFWDLRNLPTLRESMQTRNLGVPRRRVNELLVATFGLVNLILFNVISTLAPFASVERELRSVCWGLAVVISFVLLALSARSLFSRALEGVRRRVLRAELCIALALVASTTELCYLLIEDFDALLHLDVFRTLIGVVFILCLDRVTEAKFFLRLRRAIGLPPHASLSAARQTPTGEAETVAVTDLRVGDRIIVRSGESVPCDCTIEEGTAAVLDRGFSALLEPRIKGAGQPILAGTIVRDGKLLCVVEAGAGDTVASYFASLINSRIANDSAAAKTTAFGVTLVSGSLIFVAACAGLYYREHGADLPFIMEVVASTLLITVLHRVIVLGPLLKGLAVTSAFARGVAAKDSATLLKLAASSAAVIDYRAAAPIGYGSADDFEMIDARVDQKMLISALLALFGGTEQERFGAVVPYLQTLIDDPILYQLNDYRSYPGLGFSAIVQGSELSVGTEGFLIARGVQLQPSELGVSEADEQFVYVAIGSEVVARFRLFPPLTRDAVAFLDQADALGVRAYLCSEESSELVDKAGKRIRLELSSVFGGMSSQTYAEKLGDLSPAILIAGPQTSPELLQAAQLSAAPFDELRWDVDRTPITVFGPILTRLLSGIRVGRRLRNVLTLNLLIGALLSTVLLTLALAGLVAPGVVALSVFGGSCFVFLNSFRLLPEYSK